MSPPGWPASLSGFQSVKSEPRTAQTGECAVKRRHTARRLSSLELRNLVAFRCARLAGLPAAAALFVVARVFLTSSFAVAANLGADCRHFFKPGRFLNRQAGNGATGNEHVLHRPGALGEGVVLCQLVETVF